MPVIVLRALDCEKPIIDSDRVTIGVSPDGKAPEIFIRDHIGWRERWTIEGKVKFDQKVEVRFGASGIFERQITINLDNLVLDANKNKGLLRGQEEFKGKISPDYKLWYEIIPDGVNQSEYHTSALMEKISLRSVFGRTGRGAIPETHFNILLRDDLIYFCSDRISLRDTLALHKAQDGGKGDTSSIRTWIRRHCNAWGEESVIPLANLPVGPKLVFLASEPNYIPVGGEQSRVFAGIQRRSYRSTEDNPSTHESVDWLFNIFPSPPFSYMLAYTAKGRIIGDNNKLYVPYSHNELEIRSIPLEWRPFRGEYVTIWGRHIFDLGHLPMRTEMHPVHTIIREHTTAANLGSGNKMVPVNRIIIGMGSSGGFPAINKDELTERWNIEFGEAKDLSNKTRRCWFTNLKKHPLRIKLFPPVAGPKGAILKARVVLAKIITISSSLSGEDFGMELGDFLSSKLDMQGRGRFGPKQAPASVRPTLTSRGDYFDLEIDLSHSQDFPVAYYAIVECGWNERGDHHLQKYRVTFEELKALTIQSRGGNEVEIENEWSLYYGVNGLWQVFHDDNVKEDESFTIGQTMEVWTVDDLPLSIRDAGVERDPGLDEVAITDEDLDCVEFTIKGEDHLQWLRDEIKLIANVNIINDEDDSIRLKVRGKGGKTEHEWTIKIEKMKI